MSNGARHGIGVLIGLIVTPVVAGLLMYGTQRLGEAVRRGAVFAAPSAHGDKWTAAAIMLVVAIMLGLLVGSRLSPLASLVPGAVLTVVGLLWVVAPRWTVTHTAKEPFPERLVF